MSAIESIEQAAPSRQGAPSKYLSDLRHKLFRGGRLTKIGGITGSMAPEASQLGAGLLIAMGVTLGSLGFSSDAAAGSCALTLPGSLLCSGPANPGTDGPQQSISAVPLTVTTTADFGIQSKAGAALDLRGVGGASFTQTGSGSIIGATVGISLSNQTSGDITLNATGDIVGKNGRGIEIPGGVGTGNVTINVGNVESNGGVLNDAIHVEHNGTGNVAVSSTGILSGKGQSDGIYVGNSANGQNITVNANVIEGTYHGAHIESNGKGGVSLTAASVSGVQEAVTIVHTNAAATGGMSVDISGNVTSTGSTGISFTNAAGATDIHVGGDVTANGYGIQGSSSGLGQLSVVVDGKITTATAGQAVNISNTNSSNTAGTYVEVNAIDSPASGGVIVSDSTQGKAVVLARGPIVAGNGRGIAVSTGGTSAGIEITAQGSVTSTGNYGIHAVGGGTGDVLIRTQSVTTTGANAIHVVTDATSGAARIDALGPVESTNATGIYAIHNGTGGLTVQSTTSVQGNGGDGIRADSASGLVVNVNDVNAQNVGINVASVGAGSALIQATGKITTTAGNGINVTSQATSTKVEVHANEISASDHGIVAAHYGTDSLIITATGPIYADTDKAGIGLGISAANTASGKDITINVGDIQSNEHAIYVAASRGTDGLNIMAGNIVSRSGNGVFTDNAVTANLGTTVVTGAVTAAGNGFDVQDWSKGSIQITTNGKVDAGGHGIFADNTAAGQDVIITANDSIKAGNVGIYAISDGQGKLNVTAKDITSASIGVWTDNTHANSTGTVIQVGAVTSTGNDGINVEDWSAGGVAITSNGAISAAGEGIHTNNFNAGPLTIHAKGDIAAGGSGIIAYQGGEGAATITTDGVVTAQGTSAIRYSGTANSSTAVISAAKDVTGASWGIYADHSGTGALTINSQGAATGGLDGIRADSYGNGLVINAADTKGGNFGIYVPQVGSGGADITVTGSAVGVSDDGIYVSSNNNSTHLNLTVNNAQGARHGITTIQHSDVGTPGNDATINVNGVIQGGGGYGVWTESDPGVTTRLNIADTATVQSTSGNAVINDDGNMIVNVAAGAQVAGAFSLSTGSDALTFNGTNVSKLTVLDGGDDASSADGWVDTLTFNGVQQQFNQGQLINWEVINLKGSNISTTGTLVAENVNLTAGSTLDGQKQLALVGNLSIDPTSRFVGFGGGKGVYSVSGNLHNDGIVTTVDGRVGDRFNVKGNYSGTGKVLLDVNYATGVADTFTVDGTISNTNGVTTIVPVSVGGSPIATGQPIDVGSATGNIGAGSVQLAAPVTRGVWDYYLEQLGNRLVLAGKVNPIGAAYEGAPAVLLGSFASLPTLEQRVGQRQWVSRGDNGASQIEGIWFRVEGDQTKLRPDTSRSGFSSKANTTKAQVGADFVAGRSESGYWVFGATGQYGSVDSTLTNALGRGTVKGTGYGVGLSATWHGARGTYVDSQLQVNRVSMDISADAYGQLVDGEHRTALAAGVEVGHHFDMKESKHWLVPQAQLTWGRMGGSQFIDRRGNTVGFESADQLVGRVGLAYQYRPSGKLSGNGADDKMLYVIGNILRDFSSDDGVTVSGTSLAARGQRTWAEIGVGGSLQLAKGSSLYGEAGYRAALGGGASGNKGLSAKVGVRVSW